MLAQTAITSRLEPIVVQLDVTQRIALRNLDGISHEESLQQFGNGSNSVNWLVRHLVATRQRVISQCGGTADGPPNPDTELSLLKDLLVSTCERQREILCQIDDERLDGPAPFSPSGAPMGMADLLYRVTFHEAYHVGQIGLARRLLGKPGVV